MQDAAQSRSKKQVAGPASGGSSGYRETEAECFIAFWPALNLISGKIRPSLRRSVSQRRTLCIGVGRLSLDFLDDFF
jgi:hypothetical protein